VSHVVLIESGNQFINLAIEVKPHLVQKNTPPNRYFSIFIVEVDIYERELIGK
jgi:hypothetical protein